MDMYYDKILIYVSILNGRSVATYTFNTFPPGHQLRMSAMIL